MNKRNFLIVFALFLMALGAAILPTKAQDEPVRNILTLSVGCPSDFGDFISVPVNYSALYDVSALASSTNTADYTQFVGYYPDGQARNMQAGQYQGYFTVLFAKNLQPNFLWVDKVNWSVYFYDYIDFQTVSVDVTKSGDVSCSPVVEPTPTPEPNPPVDPPFVIVPEVQSTGKVCTVQYPSLVVVCQ